MRPSPLILPHVSAAPGALVTGSGSPVSIALRARGLRIVMISGDNRGAALSMGERLGLHADEVMAEVPCSGLLPTTWPASRWLPWAT